MVTATDTNLETLLSIGNPQELQQALQNYTIYELVDLITNCPSEEDQLRLFSALPSLQAVQTFENLHLNIQKQLLLSLPPQQLSSLLDELSPDDRTTLLEALPSEMTSNLIKYLSPTERRVTLKLLGYPKGSVGRIMTLDYIAVKLDWTISKALDFIRKYGKSSETIDVIYVIDDKDMLIDDIRIGALLLANPEAKIKDLSDQKFISLCVYDKQEQAVNVFRKYNRLALPVIDREGILLGIVTIDDILHVASAEDTQDIQMIGGLEALDEPYMETPFFKLMQKRAGWLVILFLGEMLTASALGFYEDEISRAVVLALFLPLIISSGGNSGSQTSTLIIRAIALREIGPKDWLRVMKREIFAGLFLGCVLGVIGFLRISLWASVSNIYGPHWMLVALTIFCSLIGVVLWGTITGAMMPLILRACKIDPATSSTPFIATLVDVTGIIIYFNIAFFILKGVLL